MSQAARPSLKLKLTQPSLSAADNPATPDNTVARTPSIKLKVKTSAVAAPEHALSDLNAVTPDKTFTPAKTKSERTRKPSKHFDELQDDRSPRPKQRLKVKVKPEPPQEQQQSAGPGHAQTIKLKHKGKVPKRPLGVGYDSELDERETDPVIIEGYILRLSPDVPEEQCKYVQDALENSKVGVHPIQGGADVKMRQLDTFGRRGIFYIRGKTYASTIVDLPCLIEGMKSWDRRSWVKSVDFSQMMLVLGPCKSDEEAKDYPLPPDVDPTNYQYAHGITAPMRWVRQRRFANTKRAKVDDIEAIERKVQALIEGDRQAIRTTYQIYDHDPREADVESSDGGSGEYSSGSGDAEGEEDDYFLNSHTGQGQPVFDDEDVDQQDVDQFLKDVGSDEDEPPPATSAAEVKSQLHVHLAPDADSSFAVTSTSASPSATAAPTPASLADQTGTSDDDEVGEEDEEEADEDDEEEANEVDEAKQQALDRIQDLQNKISEQKDQLKVVTNGIIAKKIMAKIDSLKGDIEVMRKTTGTEGDDEDD